MRRLVAVVGLMAVFALAGAGHAQQTSSKIQAIRLENGSGYLIIYDSGMSNNLETAHAALWPEMKRLCGPRPVMLGGHQFHAHSPNGPYLLAQRMLCEPVTVVTDPKWRPTSVEQHTILRLTSSYFDLKDKGDYQGARALLHTGLSFEEWLAAAEEFKQASGKIHHRTIEKVTWYKDHPNSFAPGILAAADFVGESDKFGFYCGFVTWHQEEGGQFRLWREEQNVISRERLQQMSASELARRRKEWRC